MFDFSIVIQSVVTGLMNGAVYALVALGLTLVFGVLHIINFAHGSLLMIAMYGVFFANQMLGIDPYLTIPAMMALMFAAGYLLQRFVIVEAGGGRDFNVLLITLGAALVIENLALYLWAADTRQLQLTYTLSVIDVGFALLPVTRVVASAAACLIFAALWLLIERTNFGRAMRAVAKEPMGARVVGINVNRIYALTMGVGGASLGAAGALMLPIFYVTPQVGNVFALLAFTIVVLGGMGSTTGALVGGFVIGVIESLGGLFLGESLGQIGVFALFIAILVLRPRGLFGSRV
jgi:branched-chain amino acid transport system permease protein